MGAIVPVSTSARPVFTVPDIENIANAIARGGLFGTKDPFAILTLCFLADAEGQHPAVVFRDYHLISGKPSKKAEAMQRDFQAAGGSIEWHRLDDECADATFSHPTGGSARIAWDKARVKQAGLTGNQMHAKYPRQMLRARVVSEGVRTVFPGATSGLYVPEEVAAVETVAATPATPQAQRARDIQADKPAITDKRGPARGKAEEWSTSFIAGMEQAEDGDALDALFADPKARKALDKLKADHPDLHGDIMEASAKRAAAWQEGRPDDAFGDQFDGGDRITDELVQSYAGQSA